MASLAKDDGVRSSSAGGGDAPPRVASGVKGASRAEIIAIEELDAEGISDDLVERMASEDGLDYWTSRRLLVANKGSLEQARAQREAAEAWREANRESLAAHDPGAERLVFRRGWDKLGRPLMIWNGRFHSSAKRSPEEVSIAAVSAVEEARAALDQQGLQKYSLLLYLPLGTELDWGMARAVVTVLQHQFPERLYRAYIFPTSAWSKVLFNIVSVFIDPKTTQKLLFCSGHAPAELLEDIAPEQLPEKFGGTDPFVLPEPEADAAKGGGAS